MRELIDTLWNVNESPSLHISERSRELIDTLWNVNVDELNGSLQGMTGINRYIMECKFNQKAVGIPARLELIDTLWNVNLTRKQAEYLQGWN